MAKGDWLEMETLASKICEFDKNKIIKLVQLLKKMKFLSETEKETQ